MARGGLSKDPEKKARQLAALAGGRKVLARNELGGDPSATTEPASAKAPPAAEPVPVITYPKEKRAPSTPSQGDGGQAPEPEPKPRRAGFLDGFLGRD